VIETRRACCDGETGDSAAHLDAAHDHIEALELLLDAHGIAHQS
jgi:hypothetical protein